MLKMLIFFGMMMISYYVGKCVKHIDNDVAYHNGFKDGERNIIAEAVWYKKATYRNGQVAWND